jgi:hypothetical protein
MYNLEATDVNPRRTSEYPVDISCEIPQALHTNSEAVPSKQAVAASLEIL